MTYIASVTYNGRIEILENLEYRNIRECKDQLRANGYHVRIVCRPEQFDEACEKFYEKRQKKAFTSKAQYEADKAEAKKYNTSVKTYRAAIRTLLEKDENGEYKYLYMTLEDWVKYYDEHKEYRQKNIEKPLDILMQQINN